MALSRRFPVALVAGAFLTILAPGAAHAATIAVSPGGSVSAAVAKAKPGDTVSLARGTYPLTTLRRRNATTSKPIRIVGVDRGQVVIEGLDLEYAQGLRIDDVTVTNTGLQLNGSQHITVADVTVTPATATNGAIANGVTIGRSGAHLSSNIRLTGLTVYGIHQSQTAVSSSLPPGTVNPATGTSEGHAILIGSGGPGSAALPEADWVHDITVSDSDLSFSHDSIVALDEAERITLTHDTIHDPGDNDGGQSDVFALAADGLTIDHTNLYTTHAYSHIGTSADEAILLGGGGQRAGDQVANVRIVDDLVHEFPGAGIVEDGVTNVTAVNDTIADNRAPGATDDAAGIVVGQSSTAHPNSGLVVVNDLLTRLQVEPGAAAPTTVSNNLYEVSDPTIDGQNAVVAADPGFANLALLTLLPTSPAINRGIVVSYGPKDDYAGLARDNMPDIGAREYSAASIAAVLTPPLKLRAMMSRTKSGVHPFFVLTWRQPSTRPQYFVINIARTASFSGRTAYREPGKVSQAGIRCTPGGPPYYARVRSLTYGVGRSAFSGVVAVRCTG